MKLQNLFTPDVFQSYYLLKNRFVGIHTTTSHVYVSVVEAKGYTRTLVSSHTYPLEHTQEDHEKQFIATLQQVKKDLGAYDNLIITIPGSNVVFKELTLPFISREKIALMLPLEIEPYLPFASTDAIIDFMMTSINMTEKKSTIMVAAVPKKFITDHVVPYIEAGLHPTQVTVDILALFSFVRHFSTHHANMALVAMDDTIGSTIAYCPEATLKAIRTLDTKHLGSRQTMQKAIGFTLHAFEDSYGPIQHIIVAGAHQTEQLEALKKETPYTIEPLTIHHTDNTYAKVIFENKVGHDFEPFSVATAVPTQENSNFNLISLELKQQQIGRLFSTQIIAAGLLSLLLVGSLTVHTVLQIRKLSAAANTLRTDSLKELKKRFPSIKTTNFSTALKTAQKEVAIQQELWSAFSGSTGSYLYYLATLSSAIDRDSLGLTLTKMIMNKKTITLEGKVQSFEALEALEKRLKESNLFIQIPDLQKTDFSLVLTLKPQGDAA